MSTTTSPRLTDEQQAEFLELAKDADSVELKLTVPEEQQASTAAALGVDPLEAQIRQVFFFDTPELELDKAGVVVRARRIQGKGDDSVVKLRPVVPASFPAELRGSPNFRVEVDALPGGFVCSGTLKRALRRRRRPEHVGGRAAAAEALLEGAARVLRRACARGDRARRPDRARPDLRAQAGIDAEELGRRVVGEMWLYPDGSRVVELSTRCETSEAFQVAAEARAFLTEQGVDLSGEQQTKTRKALRYFAKHAQPAA